MNRMRRLAVVVASAAMTVGGLAALPAAAQPTAAAAQPGAVRHASGPAGPVSNTFGRYKVIVQTGDETWAGTNATIKIKVYGFAATSPGYVNMDNDFDNFEPGVTDIFGPFTNWPDLGGVDFIGVDKFADGSDWQLDHVSIQDTLRNVQYECVVPTKADGYFPDGAATIWFDCP